MLVSFFKTLNYIAEFPFAWEFESKPVIQDDNEDEPQVDEDFPKNNPSAKSQAYCELLTFLEQGCSGSPLQGYPIVIIILSTIPSSVCHFFSCYLTRLMFIEHSHSIDPGILI
jgi:hypothetical protein